MHGDATFDATGRYRYRLDRVWDPDQPRVTWVALNPNTADATSDDPTIRRMIGFSEREGYGGLVVVNLFAWRCRHPKDLKQVDDPVGPDNDAHIRRAVAESAAVVAAWGAAGGLLDRHEEVWGLIGEAYVLGWTKHGHPRHPLYLRGDTPWVLVER